MKARIFVTLTACVLVQACNQPAQEEAAAPSQGEAAAPAQGAAAEPEYVVGVFAATHNASGEVAVVNDDTVMISHGPVAALDWPAMTMTYEVRDPALIADLHPGEEIDFAFRRDNFAYVLTEVLPR